MGSIPSIVTFSLCDKRLKKVLDFVRSMSVWGGKVPHRSIRTLGEKRTFCSLQGSACWGLKWRYKEVPVGATLALQGSACWGLRWPRDRTYASNCISSTTPAAVTDKHTYCSHNITPGLVILFICHRKTLSSITVLKDMPAWDITEERPSPCGTKRRALHSVIYKTRKPQRRPVFLRAYHMILELT